MKKINTKSTWRVKIRLFIYEQSNFKGMIQNKLVDVQLPTFAIEELKEYQRTADATNGSVFPIVFPGKARTDGRLYRFLDENAEEFKQAIEEDMLQGNYHLWIFGNKRAINMMRQLLIRIGIPEDSFEIYHPKELDTVRICKLRFVHSKKHHTLLPLLIELGEEDVVCRN